MWFSLYSLIIRPQIASEIVVTLALLLLHEVFLLRLVKAFQVVSTVITQLPIGLWWLVLEIRFAASFQSVPRNRRLPQYGCCTMEMIVWFCFLYDGWGHNYLPPNGIKLFWLMRKPYVSTKLCPATEYLSAIYLRGFLFRGFDWRNPYPSISSTWNGGFLHMYYKKPER